MSVAVKGSLVVASIGLLSYIGLSNKMSNPYFENRVERVYYTKPDYANKSVIFYYRDIPHTIREVWASEHTNHNYFSILLLIHINRDLVNYSGRRRNNITYQPSQVQIKFEGKEEEKRTKANNNQLLLKQEEKKWFLNI